MKKVCKKWPVFETRRLTLHLAVLAPLALLSFTAAGKNGFDLSNATVPQKLIQRGGPPKDGIVALSFPSMQRAAEAGLQDDDRILGILLGTGPARAYPVRYLTVHEIVNDRAGEQYFAVTYCPLCGSGVAFAANFGAGKFLNFGVSGLLYNSDLLMYDRNSASLWSQLDGQAISGPLAGTRLPRLPLHHTTFGAWRSRHPDTLVMAGHAKFKKQYRRNPYPGYERSRRLMFDVAHRAPGTFHPKERVLGVQVGEHFKAYPFVLLRKHGRAQVHDQLAGQTFTVHWDAANEAASLGPQSKADWLVSYWFAWFAFHPQTEVFSVAAAQ